MPELLTRTRDRVADPPVAPGSLQLATPGGDGVATLGRVVYYANGNGNGDPATGIANQPLSSAPTSLVPLAPLAGAASETWAASGQEAMAGALGPVRWAASETLLYGVVALPRAGRHGDLEGATATAYRELLATVDRLGFPHLWRVWNTLPAINADEGGLERYHRFCRARAQAFEVAYGAGYCRRLCASTAVGSHDGDGLVVHFLAGREPGVHRENPRQVSAYLYPPEYGPRSPSFARATVLPASLGGTLFISGTASIVGHESRHRDDLDGQIAETIRNLEVMLEVPDAHDQRPARRFDQLKVYLRRPGDSEAVLDALAAAFGSTGGRLDVPTLVLHADICRADLLLEIEAVASPLQA